MLQTFVHLHVHSEYSLVDSVIRIKPLMKRVAAQKMGAIAITDQHNLFALVKAYRAAMAQGIKPIIGADFLFESGDPAGLSRIVLLCQNKTGYKHLTELISRAYTEGQRGGVPILERDWIVANQSGLIALSGAAAGDVGQALLAGNQALATERLTQWQQVFGDRFYLELQRTGRPQDSQHVSEAVMLAIKQSAPVVATNDVRFLSPDDFEAQEARVCIYEGRALNDPRRQKMYSEQQYLRSPEEMAELFSDLPEALANSVEIAQRCNVELTLGESFLPAFPVPDGMDTAGYLKQKSLQGLQARLLELSITDPTQIKSYEERLEIELKVIVEMGFPGYFLIVADFIEWSRNNDIPVGPGRGSGAGSLVAYALGITDLDPLAYDLLFERFLNPERVSMPDFDIDFCMEGRDRVIDYVANYYGREKVSQIITFGTMAAKAVIRDVGRVLGHPYGFVDRIAKLVPFEIGMTLEKALEQEEELRQLVKEDEEVAALIELAQSLEGITRNAGKHAGGVVISPSRLTDFTALYCEEGGDNVVTQLDKDDVESVGLVKFDFLGLRTLTIIDWALKNINQNRSEKGEEPLDISRLNLEDKRTFSLLQAQQTTAVFQLESRGMKDLIKRLKPDCFEDIIALVALFRPGPLQSGMVDDFINRKLGDAVVHYPHPELEPILKPTYGVILYQEQVMQIAQQLAGYTLGAADLLRRAMGKKKPEEMAKQRDIFMAGATENGVEESIAVYIFDLMEKFAGYGFNKSHSAAYALLSYQTAYLKAHYPAAFMAAVLSSDMDNTDKVVTLINECREMALPVVPPDLNQSAYAFTVEDETTIRYGLGAIKGLGLAAIEGILEERQKKGLFASLYDLCCRVDLRKVNRRALEAMIRSGVMDQMGVNRATLIAQLDTVLKAAEQHARASQSGQDDLFGFSAVPAGVESTVESELEMDLPVVDEWPEKERLSYEKEMLGLYLTGHPILAYERELEQFVSGRISTLTAAVGEPSADGGKTYARRGGNDVLLAGLIVAIRRQGKRAFLTLDDRSGRVEVPLFEETFEKFGHLVVKDALIIIEGRLSYDQFSGGFKLTPKMMYDMDHAREQYMRRLWLSLKAEQLANDKMGYLKKCLTAHKGGKCRVSIRYLGQAAEAVVELDQDWSVHPTERLIEDFRHWLGAENVQSVYTTVS